ncbi:MULTISPECIES: hypothetical protein [unclassified Methylobacterium]|jgi:hypothetical protein|uniref:hypothetical protein n=1 Tax=unclassified Methylobacterium TaxID=2615210 RepID=UPI001355443D|nr:hypothetical protein [Methylobacterium sp. 2A]MWV23611.1 hypothetical protein [Methylobacterium sp. 2A]
MKRFALLSAAALIGAGTLASSAAEARGGAIAAGIIGGLAAGALIGAATQAHAAPAYGYDYGYGGYGYAPAPVVVRPAPAYRVYEEDVPVYATRRTVTYERVPVGYDRHWHHDWDGGDRGYGYRRAYYGW